MNTGFLGLAVATVLTVYGIETHYKTRTHILIDTVATVLTVYGIETHSSTTTIRANNRLQQYLPFTVLKHNK